MLLTKHKRATKPILSKLTLRRALHILGVTDTEMRLRKGCMSVLQNWTGEEKGLLELAHKRWRRLSASLHEANGGDQALLSTVNAAWAAVKRKVGGRLLRGLIGSTMSATCLSCGRQFYYTVKACDADSRKLCSAECKRARNIEHAKAFRQRMAYGQSQP